MGCYPSKNKLTTTLIDNNEINMTKIDFKLNLKSKLSLSEEVIGFDCFSNFIFDIKTSGLYPINNSKLLSFNNNNLQFLIIKNIFLEYIFKEQAFLLINLIISEINNDFLIKTKDKSFFLNICDYLKDHKNFSKINEL